MKARRGATALVSGLLFGAGLALSGMTLPSKVLGFLDVAGDWDPSLAFVMMGAIAVHFVAVRLSQKRNAPLFNAEFLVPRRKDVDGRLLGGAALFGIGWGLAGICPGPGIVNLVTFEPGALAFVGAMLAGMLIEGATLETNRKRAATLPAQATGQTT